MLIIEYINTITSGSWQKKLVGAKWIQCIIAAILVAFPGCLGFLYGSCDALPQAGFAWNSVIAAMIATSGEMPRLLCWQ